MIKEGEIIQLDNCCGVIEYKKNGKKRFRACICTEFKIKYIFKPYPNERIFLNGNKLLELECIGCGKKFWKNVDNKILEKYNAETK